MRDVHFAFKLAEAAASGAAMAIHIYGFLNREEPLPHEMFFCGTYFAYTLVSIFGMIVICLSFDIPLLIEAIIAGVGSMAFFLGSIISMLHAENDFHLMYLSDPEEANHKFFAICKVQSIVSLIAALTFMLHATFALDALIVRPTASQLAILHVSTADRTASAPLELCKPWFSWMCKKENLAASSA